MKRRVVGLITILALVCFTTMALAAGPAKMKPQGNHQTVMQKHAPPPHAMHPDPKPGPKHMGPQRFHGKPGIQHMVNSKPHQKPGPHNMAPPKHDPAPYKPMHRPGPQHSSPVMHR